MDFNSMVISLIVQEKSELENCDLKYFLSTSKHLKKKEHSYVDISYLLQQHTKLI